MMRLMTHSVTACIFLVMSSPIFGQVGAVDTATILCRTTDLFPNLPEGDVASFGQSLAYLGDLDGAGPSAFALAIGSPRDFIPGGARGQEYGQVFIAFFDSNGQIIPELVQTIVNPEGIPGGGDRFGRGLEAIGDLDGDGVTDLAVGGHADSECVHSSGALWILFLNSDGTVKSSNKISACNTMAGLLDTSDRFGNEVALLGNWDGPCGVRQVIAVAADGDDDGGTNRGAVYILFLDTDGTVDCLQKISHTAGGFGGTIPNGALFSEGLAAMGDLDGDGVPDLAVGSPGDDHGNGTGALYGSVWILFMNLDGTVKGHNKIEWDCLEDSGYVFGTYLSTLGQIDDTGHTVLAVSAPGDNGQTKLVWLLWVNSAGEMVQHLKIGPNNGGLDGSLLDPDGHFGTSVAVIDDVQGDGVPDIAVGAPGNDSCGQQYGAVWLLSLHDHQCPGDIDFSDDVNVDDLLTLFIDWGTDGCKNNGDINNDGTVSVQDLLDLFADWGPCPPD